MDIVDKNIDNGNAFDWGRVSAEYAKYRDIYPQKFYDQIVDRGLCVKGQKILDIGTGTGVIPRNMYRYGGEWVGTDISKEQVGQARLLSKGMTSWSGSFIIKRYEYKIFYCSNREYKFS